MKRLFAILLFLAFIPFINSCGEIPNVDIYASIYPIEFLVEEIVGDKYVVKSVYPRGKDVHDYEVSPKEFKSLSNSKMIFYIGLGLETVIENCKDKELSAVPTIALTHNLTLIELNSDNVHEGHNHVGEGTGFYDPHVWLDPINMKIMADTILEEIINHMDLTSSEIDVLTENCDDLKLELQKLDSEFDEVLADENIANKTIMVDHDAYAYWQLRYGIQRIRMRNQNDSPDVSPSEMKEKINQAKAMGIKYICTTKNELESSIIASYLSELDLSSDAKRQLHHLGTITASEDKTEDYFSLMRYNLSVLEEILPKKSLD